MKLIFAGTPSFAAAALSALAAAGHQILLVLTQPDRPSGRGLKHLPSEVSQVAARLQLPIAKPLTLKNADLQTALRTLDADLMIVAAYGLILPQSVLDIPRLGCINIHASLLPRWRGAAPIQRAIEAGDPETGISIMQMDAGLDTGAVLLRRTIAIAPDETSASLFEKMSVAGAAAIIDALDQLPALTATPQSDEGASYAKKILKAEAHIDWRQDAAEIERRSRAFDPFPGCETTLKGETIKIWRTSVVASSGTDRLVPGEIFRGLSEQWMVNCGKDALAIHTLQRPGGKRVLAADFFRGNPVAPHTRLGT